MSNESEKTVSTQLFAVKKILWPTDSSEQSFSALPVAVALCKQFGARLYAVQVIPPIPVMAPGMGFASTSAYGFDVATYEQELVKMTEQQMEQILGEKVTAEIETDVRVLSGEPADMICSFAEEMTADIIVMSTRGRTGLSHFMLGSVAEKTIRQSRIPVLVVPGKDLKKENKEKET